MGSLAPIYTCGACERRFPRKDEVLVIAPKAWEPWRLFTVCHSKVCQRRILCRNGCSEESHPPLETVAEWEADGVRITPFSDRGEARLEVLEGGAA